MIETDDVLAELGRLKDGRWVLGFALEAANARENALQKLARRTATGSCSTARRPSVPKTNTVEVLDATGGS